MKIPLARLDDWFVKLVAVLIIIGSVWWMAFAVNWHYRTRATDWEYLPFVVSFIFIVFAGAILSKRATQGAATVVLPFVTLIAERLGRRKTDPVVTTAEIAVPKPEGKEGE